MAIDGIWVYFGREINGVHRIHGVILEEYFEVMDVTFGIFESIV